MSALEKRQDRPVPKDSCLLVLNAAEGALQFLLARIGVMDTVSKNVMLNDNKGYPSQDSLGENISSLSPICFQSWHTLSQGAEILTPALAGALKQAHLSPHAISHIACVNGPGSFTGLRLTISTAAGLARAFGARQAGLSYLTLLAAQARDFFAEDLLPESCAFWVATHARRDLIHLQGFMPDNNSLMGVAAISEVHVVSLNEALSVICEFGESAENSAILLGSGIMRNQDFWEGSQLPQGSCLLPKRFASLDERILLRAAEACTYGREDLRVMYVRGSDAEENLEKISLTLKNDPQESRKRLDELMTKGIVKD